MQFFFHLLEMILQIRRPNYLCRLKLVLMPFYQMIQREFMRIKTKNIIQMELGKSNQISKKRGITGNNQEL